VVEIERTGLEGETKFTSIAKKKYRSRAVEKTVDEVEGHTDDEKYDP